MNLDALLFRLMRLFYEKEEFWGLRIYYSSDEYRESALRALKLLRRVDVRRFRRLQECAPTIVAVYRFGGSSYRRGIPAIFLDVAHRTSPESLAAGLVHEGTHALLHRRGIKYRGAGRARHERACVREELRFLRRYFDQRRDLSLVERNRILKEWQIRSFAALKDGWWSYGKKFRRRWRDLVESLRE